MTSYSFRSSCGRFQGIQERVADGFSELQCNALLAMITTKITKQDTTMRMAISCRKKLDTALQYLTGGELVIACTLWCCFSEWPITSFPCIFLEVIFIT